MRLATTELDLSPSADSTLSGGGRASRREAAGKCLGLISCGKNLYSVYRQVVVRRGYCICDSGGDWRRKLCPACFSWLRSVHQSGMPGGSPQFPPLLCSIDRTTWRPIREAVGRAAQDHHGGQLKPMPVPLCSIASPSAETPPQALGLLCARCRYRCDA